MSSQCTMPTSGTLPAVFGLTTLPDLGSTLDYAGSIHRSQETTVSTTDQLLENAQSYAAGFEKGDLPRLPGRRVAIVACMDARLNPYALLGLSEGDAHIIRNAGGAVTPDVIPSLTNSQRLQDTQEIALVPHTRRGMPTLSAQTFPT